MRIAARAGWVRAGPRVKPLPTRECARPTLQVTFADVVGLFCVCSPKILHVFLTYIHAYMHVYIYMHICMYVYLHTHTRSYTHTHTTTTQTLLQEMEGSYFGTSAASVGGDCSQWEGFQTVCRGWMGSTPLCRYKFSNLPSIVPLYSNLLEWRVSRRYAGAGWGVRLYAGIHSLGREHIL